MKTVLILILVLCCTGIPVATTEAVGNCRHRVQWGDTLYALALSNGTSVSAIELANPGTDLYPLIAGTVINLPCSAPPKPTRKNGDRNDNPTRLWKLIVEDPTLWCRKEVTSGKIRYRAPEGWCWVVDSDVFQVVQ